MLRRPLSLLILLASLSACAAEPTPANAPAKAAPGEAAVRAALATLLPDARPVYVKPAPFAGFSEVGIDGRVLYVSNDGRHLIQGALVDVARRENLTLLAEAGLRKTALAAVGPERRIVFAAAQPKHTVTVFTDIDCGYCRKLHEQIAEYNRLGISVEYLFYPREGIGSESFEKAVSVWCATDRRQALTAAKAGQALPRGTCKNPVTMDYDLGRRIGLDGTPAIYNADGRQIGGYVAPADMLARLEELAAKP
ncbi:thioredoxin fold domain-containing protein [Arenimonas terrae]|jgi:thiol:disulfide interchange protein DsbC|uniref:Thiol:disulfide interchange protein n=1 Tax=Arenimonas terrae TaxID=2546226 RepID=A0A5C4RY02_9GAMM|nr:thioredoxin fold domain-containing protein [Arenimonas terrae]TNJ35561.1 DsbC family protein [Arenimonas terrae]